MSKITFIISYPELKPIVEDIFREQDNAEWELDVILVTGVRPLSQKFNINSDVVIARGVTSAALKEMLGSTPVVDLPVSGYDIMRAIKECQVRFGAQRIGVAGSSDMIYGAQSIEDFMDIKILAVAVKNENDAETNIHELKKMGVDAIIGGVMSTMIAEQLGMKTVIIHTGREAVYHSLREAKRVLKVRRQEQERGEQFRAILDYSNEGIIAVNAAGIVNLINLSAQKLVNLREDIVGYPIQRFLPQIGFDDVLRSGGAELGEVEQINGQQVVINRVPIKIGNQMAGAVATFQPVAAIQEVEGRIRRKIYHRGHVARQTFGDIEGGSPSIRRAIKVAQEFSKVNSTVLIYGETGTGKEIFAQSIHNASGRRQGPFVVVNCAALPENLLESELFGYVEGAFTGAARGGKVGLFELAHQGTIFLDEISEVSPPLQGRLLRVLQEREIMRVGDGRVIPVNVRVIAATNRNLRNLMEKGLFREDLYYRVDILQLVIPPLRERREDIAPLAEHFLAIYFLRSNKRFKKILPDALDLLCRYNWPGNVRELRNIAERLAVLSRGGSISVRDIAAVLPQFFSQENTEQGALIARQGLGVISREAAVLLKVLAEANYHYGHAAALLGISRTTLWRRLKQYGLDKMKRFEINETK